MSDVPPPEEPGWYADARGAWWYWDGSTWTAAPPAPGAPGAVPDAPGVPAAYAPYDHQAALEAARRGERTMAMLVWVISLVAGFIGPLILYLVAGREKRFVRHHGAEALNLAIVMTVLQLVVFAPMMFAIWEDIFPVDESTSAPPPGWFWIGFVVLMALAIVNLVLTIVGILRANSGAWWRVPIGFHPVRGVLPRDEEPPYPVV